MSVEAQPSVGPRLADLAGRLATLPLYPALFALYFVVRLYADNMALFGVGDIVRPAVALAGLAIVTQLAVRHGLRASAHNAAAGTFALFFVLTLAGEFARFLGPSFVGSAGFALVALVVLLIGFAGAKSYRTTSILNLFTAALLVLPLYNIARAQIGESPVSAGVRLAQARPATVPDVPPSIIHVTLDGYSRGDVLTEVYGYDNAPFLRSLEAMGFAVFDAARSPYNQTLPNMAAVFSGEYLDFGRLKRETLNADDMRRMLGRHVGDSPVMAFLRRLGYTILATDTGYEFFDFRNVDRLSSPRRGASPFSLFEATLYKRSGLNVLVTRGRDLVLGADDGAATRGSLGWVARHVNELVRHAFSAPFPETARGPYFLYQHILSPHPPFTIDRDGQDWARYANLFYEIIDGSHVIHGSDAIRKAYIAGYSEKLAYTNRALQGRVTELIDATPGPVIVILHGDHGGGAYFEQQDGDATCVRERFSPLLAIYASDPAWHEAIVEKLRRSPNLANIYPAIFDSVFGTELGLAASRSEFMSWSDPFRPQLMADERLAAPCGGR